MSSYDLSPSRAGRAVTDDIGSLSASLKSLATLVQTLDNKLADEKAQRLRLEEKVQQLARGGDDTSGKLSKLEKSLQHQLDDVVGQVTATGVENREAWGALSTTVESYNDEVEDRVNQLAKTLVSASRDAKDRSEGLEREFQSALAASALAMEEQASRVEARFVTERKGTSEKWDAVERNLTSRMEPLEARLAESRASLTRMLEESNRGHNASRERQQKLMNEQSAKLRQQIGDANSVTTERLDKSMSDMEEKVGKSVEEVVQLLGRLKNGLEEKQSSMERRHEEAMDDQIKIRQAAEARLKEEIAGARSELRDLVSTTKAEMAAADEALGAECAANLKTTADDLAYDLDTLKEELVATEDTLAAKIMEEEVARKALDTSFTEKLGSSVRLLGDLVDKTEAELTAAIDQLRQKVEVDVKEQIAQLDTVHTRTPPYRFGASLTQTWHQDVNARLSALKELVDGKVSKSIEEMTGKMDTMNARIKQEMAPRCAPVPRRLQVYLLTRDDCWYAGWTRRKRSPSARMAAWRPSRHASSSSRRS